MRVVHCKKEPYTHYIGRPGPLGNHFSHRPSKVPGTVMVISREVAIDSFELWARHNPQLMENIRNLPEDTVLGCWCKPQACHGDVIVKLWKEMHED